MNRSEFIELVANCDEFIQRHTSTIKMNFYLRRAQQLVAFCDEFKTPSMKALVPARNIQNLIFEFRGMKVMIDVDLAALYETSTRRLREQVRRNKIRFRKTSCLCSPTKK